VVLSGVLTLPLSPNSGSKDHVLAASFEDLGIDWLGPYLDNTVDCFLPAQDYSRGNKQDQARLTRDL